jgi:hypothetical protein
MYRVVQKGDFRMDNKIWFNQMMLYHKDSEFNSEGVLEIAISNYTSDYKTFSSPNLILSLNNGNSRRSFTLNYQNSYDLLESFLYVLKNSSSVYSQEQNYEIFKKYHYDRSLKVEFRKFSGNPVVAIFIYYNESDFGKIIIPFKLFETIFRLLKYCVENYVSIGFNMSSRSISTEILEQLKGVNVSIRTIPSMISSPSINIKNMEIDVPDSILKESEDKIHELDSFMENSLETIVLPEEKSIPVENKPEGKIEISSKFLDKVINKDLSVLENLMTSAAVTQYPITAISETIKKSLGIDLLDGISEKDLKSSIYLSKLIYLTSLNCYSNFDVPIPSSLPVIKAKLPVKMNSETSDIIFDLLTFSGYVRCLRSKLESKINDATTNKAIFYMGLRCFTDIFVYSFLDTLDPNVIKSCVLNRFKSYRDKKVFENYDELLVSYNCSLITERDIEEFLNILISKVIGKSKFVDEIHSEMYSKGAIKLSSDNNFTLEQIIKMIVPAEVFTRLQNKIEDYHEELPENVLELFKIVEEKKVDKKKEPKKNNITRFVKSFESEIPEEYKKEFLTYIDSLSDNFDYTKFKLNEFGDNIVKGVYEWNESNKTEKYTDFYDRCENSLMSKDLILAKMTIKKEEKSDDWFGNLEVD